VINTLLALIDILKSTNWRAPKNREKKDFILGMSRIKRLIIRRIRMTSHRVRETALSLETKINKTSKICEFDVCKCYPPGINIYVFKSFFKSKVAFLAVVVSSAKNVDEPGSKNVQEQVGKKWILSAAFEQIKCSRQPRKKR